MFSRLISILLVGLLAAPALARTVLVRPDGNGEYPTIQDAIDAVAWGDTVSLEDGVYVGTGNRDLIIAKPITLCSRSDSPHSCIIDCEGLSRALTICDPSESGPLKPSIKAPTYPQCPAQSPPDSLLRSVFPQSDNVVLHSGERLSRAQDATHSTGLAGSRLSLDGDRPVNELHTTGINIVSIHITNGMAADFGGGIFISQAYSMPVLIHNSIVSHCQCGDDGAGICVRSADSVTITNSVVVDNTAIGHMVDAAGLQLFQVSNATVSGTIIAFNDCIGECYSAGGVWMYQCGTVHLYSSTVAYNTSYTHSDLVIMSTSFTASQCIVWTNEMPARAISADLGRFFCCDLPIATPNNICLSPRFCDPDVYDFHVSEISPCAPQNNDCGVLIGAMGAGCTPPAIVIEDVPDDEGGWLLLSWRRFPEEGSAGNPQIQLYDIQRMDGQWTTIHTMAVAQVDTYVVVVETSDILTVGEAQPFTRYRVVGRTQDAGVSYSCMPDSGYSIDNRAPSAPAVNLYDSETSRVLLWQNPTAADFRETCLYRGSTPGFAAGDPFLCSTSIYYSEPHLALYYYRARSYDIHGNASEWSNEVVGRYPTGVPATPTALRLYPNQPNPFNPMTTIRFDVPVGGRVRLEVYDVAGRLVRILVEAELSPGSHEAVWDGRDSTGRALASGSYFARLSAGGRVETVRMGLVR